MPGKKDFNGSAKNDLAQPGFQYIENLLAHVGDKKMPAAVAREVGMGVERDLGLEAGQVTDKMAAHMKAGHLDKEGLLRSLGDAGNAILEDSEIADQGSNTSLRPGTLSVTAATVLENMRIKDPAGTTAVGLSAMVALVNAEADAKQKNQPFIAPKHVPDAQAFRAAINSPQQ